MIFRENYVCYPNSKRQKILSESLDNCLWFVSWHFKRVFFTLYSSMHMCFFFKNWVKTAVALCLTVQTASFESMAQTVAYQSALAGPTSIDLNRPVGTLAGGMSVSSSGAASYSIPIKVVPGTMGVEPTISLEYNSQAGNGQLGWGWSLSGMSAITRVGPDNYHDGRVEPIQWNNNDFYSLDGSRLTMLSGGGGTGSIFATESESWSKIESMGWLGSGPEWFKVWLKDGTVCEYGHQDNPQYSKHCQLMNNTGTEILAWKLSKKTDVHGNYSDYYYDDNGGENKLRAIWYTGSLPLGKLPYQRVDFDYEERSDVNTVYEGGSAYNSKYLLTKVICYGENSQVQIARTYNLRYKYSDQYSFLQSVSECNDIGNCFNESQFIYGELNEQVNSTSIPELSSETGTGYETVAGDFNGDGISDVVRYQKQLINNALVIVGLKVSTSTGGATPAFNDIYTYPLQANYYAKTSSAPNSYNFHYSDYDGDGTDDILLIEKNQDTLLNITLITKVNAQIPTITHYPPPTGYKIAYENLNTVLSGDFDGDGRVDFILNVFDWIGNAKLYMTSPGKGYINESIQFPTGSLPISNNMLSMCFYASIDFDGNRKNEVICTNKDYFGNFQSKTKIFSFERNSQGVWNATNKFEAGYPTCWHSILLGDFNGDGKTDLLTRTNDGTDVWEVAFSNGINFETTQNLSFPFIPAHNYRNNEHNNNWAPSDGDDQLLLSDFDGDGKTDIITISNSGSVISSDRTFYQHYSRGKNIWKHSTHTEQKSKLPRYLIADFTGDGKADLIYSGASYENISFREGSQDKLLSKTRNGIGRSSYFQYKNFSQIAPELYEWSGNTNYPFNTIKIPYYAVDQTWTNYAGTTVKEEQKIYKYKNLLFHKGGKGMLGFAETSIFDANTNIRSTNTVSNWDVTKYLPQKTVNEVSYVMNPYNIQVLTRTTNDYVITPFTGFRFKYQLDFTKTEDILQGTYVAKRFWYDVNGNAYKVASEVNGWQEEDVEETTYAPTTTTLTLVPALPASIKKTHTRFGAPSVSATTTYVYQNGKLIEKTDFAGQAKSIFHQYIVNPVGLTEASYTTAGGQTRYSFTGYDPLYRFATSATNALGEAATKTYNYNFGVPLVQTGADLLQTSYSYDAFGRLTGTIVPDGYTITRNYTWGSTPASRYQQTVTHPGQGTTKVTYDDRERERGTSTSLWGSGGGTFWSTSDKYYKYTGQIESETAPRFPNEPAFTTTYHYDVLNRLDYTENPIGRTTYTYTYGGGTSKVEIEDPAGHKTSKETDAAGKVLKSTTEGGTVRYDYDSWGNAIRTYVGSGNAYFTSSVYDDYNRRSQYTESSAGATKYTYNDFGELLTETDAAGKVTTTGYDLLGRVTERTGDEGTTTYEYWGTQQGATGQLKNVFSFNPGHVTSYDYNAAGHPSNISETLNGQVYTTAYGYDAFGRKDVTVYPNNGPLIQNHYNDHGLLTQVSAGPVMLYDVQSINGQGQTLQALRGNGKSTINTYQYGALLRSQTPIVQDYQLTYDWPRSLILTRQDNAVHNVIEDFQYDGAGRLVTSTLSNPFAPAPMPQYVTYGTGGSADNIIEKSDIGQFKYQTAKQHALSFADNAASQISVQTQDISYTSFHRPETLTEDGWEMTFQYGPDYERRQTELRYNGNLQETRWYLGSGSEQHVDATNGTVRDIFYIPGPDGVAAIYKVENGQGVFMYPYADHLGSIVAVTNAGGDVACRQAFDPWGRRRNPYNWTISDNALPSGYSWLRGFTGHEHLPQFKLINMNARLYDPLLGRMLSPDNYVTDASNPMTYNLYSYANNNPISHVDPDGNHPLIVAAAVYFVFFTDMGYQAQKQVLPVAFKVDWHFGSEKVGIGFDVSVGTPKFLSYGQPSDRWSYGKTYFDYTYGDYSGWETRQGKESSTWGGMYSNETTKYSFNTSDGEFNQTIGTISYGVRGMLSLELSNDLNEDGYNGDGGDRWRTAAGRISAGPFELGLNMFTGDPGPFGARRIDPDDGPYGTYNAGPYGGSDKHRSGGLYVGAFGLRVGWNSESIRNFFQNKMVHDKKEIPRFKNLGGSGSPLFQFGSSGIW